MKIPGRSRSKVGFMMTPMIDVVFLLIIFFLVSSHLVRQEKNTNLALPIAPTAEEDNNPNISRLTVNVETDGTLIVSGRKVSTDRLEAILNSERETKGEDFEVRIRASRLARYASVEPVMLASTRAKIWNVSYAVYREEQSP